MSSKQISNDQKSEKVPESTEVLSGSVSMQAGSRLAQKVLGLSYDSNPFCVFLPAASTLPPARSYEELIQRAKTKQHASLEPDMSSPVAVSFFEGIGATPELIEEFCASQIPPLSVEIFQGDYSAMPEDILSKIGHLDAVPEKPICYKFSVAGIFTAKTE